MRETLGITQPVHLNKGEALREPKLSMDTKIKSNESQWRDYGTSLLHPTTLWGDGRKRIWVRRFKRWGGYYIGWKVVKEHWWDKWSINWRRLSRELYYIYISNLADALTQSNPPLHCVCEINNQSTKVEFTTWWGGTNCWVYNLHRIDWTPRCTECIFTLHTLPPLVQMMTINITGWILFNLQWKSKLCEAKAWMF